MSIIKFPTILVPRTIDLFPVSMSQVSNQSLGGVTQTGSPEAVLWSYKLVFNTFTETQKIRAWRVLTAGLSGRSNSTNIPVWDNYVWTPDVQLFIPTLGVPWDPETAWDGPTYWDAEHPMAYIEAEAGENTFTVDLTSYGANVLLDGQYIGIQKFLDDSEQTDLYQIQGIIKPDLEEEETLTTITVTPPLRRDYDGHFLTARPRLTCNQISNEGGRSSLELGRFMQSPSLDLLETVDW